jgi:hypothetical protein
LQEVYATLVRRFSREEARAVTAPFLPRVVSGAADVALVAGEFRQTVRVPRKDCSYLDAWGYAMALER